VLGRDYRPVSDRETMHIVLPPLERSVLLISTSVAPWPYVSLRPPPAACPDWSILIPS